MDKAQVGEAAAAVGLHHGRIVAASKHRAVRRSPATAYVFNASICDAAGEDLWWGDLDLTVDEPRLLDLAAALGETLFVMAESSILNGRHGTPLSPATEAVLVVRPDRTADQPEGSALPFERGPDGRLAVPASWRRPSEPQTDPAPDADRDSDTQDHQDSQEDEETP